MTGAQVRLADALDGGHRFPLGHDIHRIDVIDTLDAVQIALMDSIDADVARQAVGRRRLPHGDGYRAGPCLRPCEAPLAIGLARAQVVQMRHRDLRQAFVARIAIDLPGPLRQRPCSRPRERVVQAV